MKFVVASYGTRGDIEPCAAVGLELQRRGHDVCLAVPPSLIGFVKQPGCLLSHTEAGTLRSSSSEQFLHNAVTSRTGCCREAMAPVTARAQAEPGAMLTPVAPG